MLQKTLGKLNRNKKDLSQKNNIRQWNFLTPRLKNSYISQNGKWDFLALYFPYISEGNFASSKS